jgi:hypothetical protein
VGSRGGVRWGWTTSTGPCAPEGSSGSRSRRVAKATARSTAYRSRSRQEGRGSDGSEARAAGASRLPAPCSGPPEEAAVWAAVTPAPLRRDAAAVWAAAVSAEAGAPPMRDGGAGVGYGGNMCSAS